MPTRAELDALAAKRLIDPQTAAMLPPDPAPAPRLTAMPPASSGIPIPEHTPDFEAMDNGSVNQPAMPTSNGSGMTSGLPALNTALYAVGPEARGAQQDADRRNYEASQPHVDVGPMTWNKPGGGAGAGGQHVIQPGEASGDEKVGDVRDPAAWNREDLIQVALNKHYTRAQAEAMYPPEMFTKALAPNSGAAAKPSPGGGGGAAPPSNLMAGLRGGVVYNPVTGEIVHEKPAVDNRDPRVIAQEQAFEERGKMKDAAAEKAKAEIDRADEQYRIRRAADLRIQDQEAQDKEARAKDDQAVHQRVQDVDAAVADYANSKVDPQAYYTNQSTAQRAFGILSAAVGGMAGAMNGTNRNDVLAAMQKSQEQDIAAQVADINVKGRVADAKRSALHDMMQITGSQDAARSALRASMWEGAKRQLLTDAAKYEGRIDQAELKNYVAGIDEKIAQDSGALKTQLRNEAAAKNAAARAAAAAAEEKQFQRGRQLDADARDWKKLNLEAAKTNGDTGVSIPGPDGQPIFAQAASKEDAKEIREAASVYADLRGTIAAVRKLREDYGAEVVDRAAIGRANDLAASARTQLKDLQKLGALSATDYKLIDDQIPAEPLDWWRTDASTFATLDTTAAQAGRKFQNTLNARLKAGSSVAITPEARAAQSTVQTHAAPGGK